MVRHLAYFLKVFDFEFVASFYAQIN